MQSTNQHKTVFSAQFARRRTLFGVACVCLAQLLVIQAVTAKNIDLVTLPIRESVQLTIYNSADITLVKETRFVH